MPVQFRLDGRDVTIVDDSSSLLDSLRDECANRSVKDGCSPQGQCGCCTVWVDGSPRVACVTPVRRVAGREVTTAAGLSPELAERWATAFLDCGATQCGFCTPGIVMRLAALDRRAATGRSIDEAAIRTALAAHLCRCTGWQTIVEAAGQALGVPVGPADDQSSPPAQGSPAVTATTDPLLGAWRAQLEGAALQSHSRHSVLGSAPFADDAPPDGAVVRLIGPDGDGLDGSTPGEYGPPGQPGEPLPDPITLAGARRRSAKVQGRNSTLPLGHPVELPPSPGPTGWALSLQTTWVEPAYLEPDASWCDPGGTPASPLANGGAFGAKRRSPVGDQARRMADRLGRPVRLLWPREEVVRRGPKRPPIAAGLLADGRGVVRVGVTPGSEHLGRWKESFASLLPDVVIEEVALAGPPVSADLRAAGWAEAAILLAGLRATPPGRPVEVTSPAGGRAQVSMAADGTVSVQVWAGDPVDPVILRSYCIGAVHQALGWVRSEGVAVDAQGQVHDLTIRSYGVLSARDTPWVNVTVHPEDRWPVNGSDAVFAATAAAAWIADGLAPKWPTRRADRHSAGTPETAGTPGTAGTGPA